MADAEPDGHTLMFSCVGTHLGNPALQKLSYDPLTDLVPVGFIGSLTTLAAAPGYSGIDDMAGLIRRSREAAQGIGHASG